MPLYNPPSSGSGNVAADTLWDAKGDLAGGTGANTAAKLTVGTNGFVLTADSAETTGLKWAAGPAAGSITYATADCSADNALAADTQEDATGCSVSLAAGTWLIFGYMSIAIAAASYAQILIADSSNVIYGVGQNGNNASATLNMSAHAIVSPGSTTTYKLRGQSGNGTIKQNDGTASHVLTRITAIKVA